MNQKSSLPEVPQLVSQVRTGNNIPKNSNPDVMMVKSAKDGVRFDAYSYHGGPLGTPRKG